ncbi:30S ribosomal protein S4e [Halomarina oriensis]|uniref:Small ribosomal subunit protein eS4 n=1 Tax=Halomarina oriensis TaxID=671145 RepID=A0A6B0GMJ0_9EURY|nr:30S ribosomal protein S4e [Halomarina oriensis]MWG35141.1 30S ribosomal protein S4e [Halomarina oriensis]
MSDHQKRLSAPTSWPVARKTKKYTVKAGAGPHGQEGVPLLILLRDVLGYVDSKKEARYALDQGSIVVNGQAARDERRPIGMFDILGFVERGEFYRVFPDEGGRLALTPIDADSADSKLGKVAGKQTVAGGQTQLTLHDGQTLLVEDDSIGGGDSVVVDNEDKSVVAHFPYEEGALVTAVRGQHAGQIGTIGEIAITAGSGPNNVTVEQDGDAGFETIADYVVVIDENFVEGDGESADAPEDVTEEASSEVEADTSDDDEVSDE